jgi:hypothetical protein
LGNNRSWRSCAHTPRLARDGLLLLLLLLRLLLLKASVHLALVCQSRWDGWQQRLVQLQADA